MFIRQIKDDSMLLMVLFAPLLYGVAARFGVPLLDSAISEQQVLRPYYLLFDVLLSMMSPFMFSFASSMVMLSEADDNIAAYTFVTPVGRGGYLLSRFAFGGAIGFAAGIVLMEIFSLEQHSLAAIAVMSLISTLLSVISSMVVVTVSKNRVEGMAINKGAGILMLGCLAPFFLPRDVAMWFAFMPSFWTAHAALAEAGGESLLPSLGAGIAISAVWMALLYRRFARRMR